MKEYTPAEVADMCRVKTITVWDWIRKGKLKARKQLKSYRISEKQLEDFKNGKEEK